MRTARFSFEKKKERKKKRRSRPDKVALSFNRVPFTFSIGRRPVVIGRPASPVPAFSGRAIGVGGRHFSSSKNIYFYLEN